MRRSITVLIVAILLLNIPGLSHAAAAETRRRTDSSCIEFDVGYEFCYESVAIDNLRKEPSGRWVWISHSRYSSSVLYNGDVIQTSASVDHYISINLDNAQVERFNGWYSLPFTDPVTGETRTCTYSYIWVYTNTGVAHDADETVCE